MGIKFNKNKFPNKYLDDGIDDEDHKELLDNLWENNTSSHFSLSDEELKEGYLDVKRRIIKRRNNRIKVWSFSLTSVASIFLFLIIFFQRNTSTNMSTESVLVDMGVNISQEQVQLLVGDSILSNLSASAKIHIDEKTNIELLADNGERIKVDKATNLKIYVPTGKIFNLELSDGTKVTLNAETLFEYPSTFEFESERKVKLKGEGFFNVKSDSKKKFCVEMPNGEYITVLGTSFNISSYEESNENTTTLISGKVSYNIPVLDKSIELKPNQQLCVNTKTSSITRTEVDAMDYIMWKDGIIYFDNERLVTIAKKLSRMYGIEINVLKKYENYSFSGLIKNERGVEHIINLITTTSNIKCNIQEGVIYLE